MLAVVIFLSFYNRRYTEEKTHKFRKMTHKSKDANELRERKRRNKRAEMRERAEISEAIFF
jgi:hypothetical protein